MQGVYTAQWFGMLVNNLQYGKLKFAGEFSAKKCITIIVLSMLLFVPFIAVVLYIVIPAFFMMTQYAYAAGDDPEQLALLMGPFYGKLMFSYLLYIAGAVVCYIFAFVKLRNYLYSQLTLEGDIRFSSTVTIGRVFVISVTNLLVCCVTLFWRGRGRKCALPATCWKIRTYTVIWKRCRWKNTTFNRQKIRLTCWRVVCRSIRRHFNVTAFAGRRSTSYPASQ